MTGSVQRWLGQETKPQRWLGQETKPQRWLVEAFGGYYN